MSLIMVMEKVLTPNGSGLAVNHTRLSLIQISTLLLNSALPFLSRCRIPPAAMIILLSCDTVESNERGVGIGGKASIHLLLLSVYTVLTVSFWVMLIMCDHLLNRFEQPLFPVQFISLWAATNDVVRNPAT